MENAPEREDQDCIDRMEALGGELRVAMRAIAENDIGALEQSVLRQVEGSARLRAALHGWDPQGAGIATPERRVRVGKAARELSRSADKYAAVLEHSGRSARMLQALYGQRCAADSGGRLSAAAERPQWSWEV